MRDAFIPVNCDDSKYQAFRRSSQHPSSDPMLLTRKQRNKVKHTVNGNIENRTHFVCKHICSCCFMPHRMHIRVKNKQGAERRLAEKIKKEKGEKVIYCEDELIECKDPICTLNHLHRVHFERSDRKNDHHLNEYAGLSVEDAQTLAERKQEVFIEVIDERKNREDDSDDESDSTKDEKHGGDYETYNSYEPLMDTVIDGGIDGKGEGGEYESEEQMEDGDSETTVSTAPAIRGDVVEDEPVEAPRGLSAQSNGEFVDPDDVEVVEIPCKADLNGISAIRKAAFWMAQKLGKRHTRTMMTEFVRSNDFVTLLGQTFSKTTKKGVDVLYPRGYIAVMSLKVYPTLLYYLINQLDTATPKALNDSGEETSAYINFWLNIAFVRGGQQHMMVRGLNKKILENTVNAANVHKVWSESFSRLFYTKDEVMVVDFNGLPDASVELGVTRMPYKELDVPYEPQASMRFKRIGDGWDGLRIKESCYEEIDRRLRRSYAPYATKYMSVGFDTLVYPRQSRRSHEGMITRLTNKRFEEEGKDEQMWLNQDENFPEDLWNHFDTTALVDIPSTEVERILEAIKHQKNKKKLYEKTWEEAKDVGRLIQNAINEMKLKEEITKAGKLARVFINLGIPATLIGSFLLKMVKGVINGRVTIPQGTIDCCLEPTPESLNQWANLATNGPEAGRYAASVFSDDGFLVFRRITDGALVRLNVDISKCDVSHGHRVFQCFGRIFQEQHQVRLWNSLFKQIMRPLQLVYRGKPLKGVKLKPLTPFLPSGHVFTTAINTFVMTGIMRECMKEGVQSAEDVIRVGEKLGYKLTVETCQTEYDAQFLKHSPARDTGGNVIAIKNLGVLLRALGRTIGDLPGTGDVTERARLHMCATIRSFCGSFQNHELNNWITRLNPPRSKTYDKNKNRIEQVLVNEWRFKSFRADTRPFVSMEEMMRRYVGVGKQPASLGGLIAAGQQLVQLQVGNWVSRLEYDAIGLKDYGIERDPEPRYSIKQRTIIQGYAQPGRARIFHWVDTYDDRVDDGEGRHLLYSIDESG